MSEFLRFRGSSKFFLILMLPVIALYLIGHIWRMIWSDCEAKSGANISAMLQCFLKVIEIDMAYTFLIYFICIECTAFHEFASICSTIVVALSFIFTFVHSIQGNTEDKKRRKHWMLLACKLANVTLTILGFFQLFIADMYFTH